MVDTLMCCATKTSNEVSSVTLSDLKTVYLSLKIVWVAQNRNHCVHSLLFPYLIYCGLTFFKHLKFKETNLVTLQQFNALAQMHRIEQLTVDPQGNPVVNFTLWKYYVLFRLNHFNLQKINGVKVGQCCFLLTIGRTR